ncbi:FAD-dependent oxidoreductase [Rhodococcus sp. JVH1]|uniref:NAD(P)/FAD-dependent oxidoreductase n=1 Tax=Rhodococcus sp. JVH1 TaxID=745408 RepID=UPI000686C7B3
MNVEKIVVVGASLAGLRTAEALRRHGFAGSLTVIGDEAHAPYNRPPLSKSALGENAELTDFQFPHDLGDDVTWRLGVRAVSADLDAGRVELDDSDIETFDVLVAATGLTPRRLDLPGPAKGRHVVRTYDDARALAPELRDHGTVVILGASFIGCEIASAARALGCDVTIVAPETEPMIRVLGEELGAAMRRRHEANGVRFLLGRMPTACEGTERVENLHLDDGTVLTAPVVVEAVGCRPETGWLDGNGLDLSDGVLCDNSLRAVGHERLFAVGDVARFPNPLIDDVPRRIEHWSMATDTGNQAARTLLGEPGEFRPVPSFWSDQVGLRIQAYGVPGLADRHEVAVGKVDSDVVVHSYRDERLVGVIGIGHRRALIIGRQRLIAEGAVALS